MRKRARSVPQSRGTHLQNSRVPKSKRQADSTKNVPPKAALSTKKIHAASHELTRELEGLHGKLHIAYCAATAIRLALRNGLEDADEDIGTCMEHHVLEELHQLREQLELIVVELGGKPQFMQITDSAS